MKLKSVGREIRSKVYKATHRNVMEQVTTQLHKRVDNFESQVWVEIDKIILDRQIVLRYTYTHANHKRGNTND